jgi:hypothetical protein
MATQQDETNVVHRADGVVAAEQHTWGNFLIGGSDHGPCDKEEPCRSWFLQSIAGGESHTWTPSIPSGDLDTWNGLSVYAAWAYTLGWPCAWANCACGWGLIPEIISIDVTVTGLPGGGALSGSSYWSSLGGPFPGTQVNYPIYASYECGDHPPMPTFTIDTSFAQIFNGASLYCRVAPLRFNDVPDMTPMPDYPETPPPPQDPQPLGWPPCGKVATGEQLDEPVDVPPDG